MPAPQYMILPPFSMDFTAASTSVAILGIQLFTIGIVGQYLAKTYLEVKKRPIYIVGETEEDL